MSRDKLAKLLESLSDDDVDALEDAIVSIKQKKNPEKQQPKQGGKRKKPRKPRNAKANPVQPPQKRRIITQETENLNQGQRQQSKGKRAPQRREGRRGQKKRTGGSPCRVEPIAQQDRPNLFLTSKLSKKHRADSSIDKKLSGGNEMTEREGIRLIEVECVGCHYLFDVSPKVVFMEDGEIRYKCDECQAEHGSEIGSERNSR